MRLIGLNDSDSSSEHDWVLIVVYRGLRQTDANDQISIHGSYYRVLVMLHVLAPILAQHWYVEDGLELIGLYR